MDRDTAEIRAMTILAWLAGDEDLISVFMGATGASESDLRARAGEADFLASVLDFILMDDRWVLDCARDLGLRPDDIVATRSELPGGALPNWT